MVIKLAHEVDATLRKAGHSLQREATHLAVGHWHGTTDSLDLLLAAEEADDVSCCCALMDVA